MNGYIKYCLPLIGVEPRTAPRPVELIREIVGALPGGRPRVDVTGTGVIFSRPPLRPAKPPWLNRWDGGVRDLGGRSVTFTSMGGIWPGGGGGWTVKPALAVTQSGSDQVRLQTAIR